MPGKYDPEERQIILETTVEQDAKLTVATLIQMTVLDFLAQKEFAFASRPEMVDIAVVATGLGILRSKIKLVETYAPFWDQSNWMAIGRPFLDDRCLAHVNAVAAWSRHEQNPDWIGDLNVDLQGDVRKSLKYLFKTQDCAFNRSADFRRMQDHTQLEWFQMARGKSKSQQVFAIFNVSGEGAELEALMLEKLRSRDQPIVLHALGKVNDLKLDSDPVVDEIRLLVESSSNDDIRAKALLVLSEFKKVDPETMDLARKMLSSRVGHVEFAAIAALSTLNNIPDRVLQSVEKSLIRSLQFCNYDLLNYYLYAFNRWLEDPDAHLENVLADESPEYLRIAIESLDQIQNPPAVSPSAT